MGSNESREHQYHRPGELVPSSGLYEVIHDGHRPPHKVIALRSDKFPPCRTCGEELRFLALQAVSYINHDMDLAGPLAWIAGKKRAHAAGKRVGA